VKKTILNVTLILLLILSLTACNEKKEVVIDIEALTTEATAAAEFREEMQELNDDVIVNIYSSLKLSNVEKYKVFVNSTGGKADELAIFEAKSVEQAEEIYNAVMERIDDLKFSFEGYVPEELKHLDNAVLKKEGKYVLFVISEKFENVNEIFTKYIKGTK
jgi:predicted small secreted protein